MTVWVAYTTVNIGTYGDEMPSFEILGLYTSAAAAQAACEAHARGEGTNLREWHRDTDSMHYTWPIKHEWPEYHVAGYAVQSETVRP